MERILLIDDDPEVLDLVSRFLTSDGFEVRTAGSMEVGHDLIASNEEFDAAIIDFWLGTNSAVSIFDALFDQRPDLPVVMVSGGGKGVTLEATRAIGEVSGVFAFLQKPFRRSELLTVLKETMRN